MEKNFTPSRSRVNFRLFLFLAVLSAPFIWGAYAVGRMIMNGGVEDMGAYKKVDLKALGYFNFDNHNGTVTDVPPQFRKLDGQKVMLEGFMFSRSAANRLHDFEFVYNVAKCCFNGPPLVQERVFAHCQGNKTLRYDGNYIRVIGTLHVKLEKDDQGKITSVYSLDVDKAGEV